MHFDRQLLYLAFFLGSQRVSGLAIQARSHLTEIDAYVLSNDFVGTTRGPMNPQTSTADSILNLDLPTLSRYGRLLPSADPRKVDSASRDAPPSLSFDVAPKSISSLGSSDLSSVLESFTSALEGSRTSSSVPPTITTDPTTDLGSHHELRQVPGPTGFGETASGPTGFGETASGPTLFGATVGGPTASGETAFGPTASGALSSGPAFSGAASAGPTASGAVFSGAVSSGAAFSGALSSGAMSSGAASFGAVSISGSASAVPLSSGPASSDAASFAPVSSAAPSSAAPSSAAPSSAAPSSAAPSSAAPSSSIIILASSSSDIASSSSLFPSSSSTSQTTPTIIPTTSRQSRTTTRPTTSPTTTSFTLTHSTTTNTHTGTIASITDASQNGSSGSHHPISNASVAGIVSGLAAGAVMVGLAGVYLWRRKKQGKPLFGARGSKRSTGSFYPKSAWLYDPEISPNHSRSTSEVGQNLIPAPRPDTVEMEAGMASPDMRPSRSSSPLLPPVITVSRDDSPGREPGDSPRRSGGRRSRPMMSINEEDE